MKTLGELEVILGNLLNFDVRGTAASISSLIGGTSWISGQ